jgi:hypothetical protein
MARQAAPKLMGLLKRPQGAKDGWEIEVWMLPNGVLRLHGKKATSFKLDRDTGEVLRQMTLEEAGMKS